jgi:hypothetical protein
LKDKRYSLIAQIGVIPNSKGKIILYKKVNKIGKKYFSIYDSNFEYKIREIASVKDYENSDKSCAKGIHLSNPLYYEKGNCLLECEVDFKDIITIQEGKVRCKKCKVLREVKL